MESYQLRFSQQLTKPGGSRSQEAKGGKKGDQGSKSGREPLLWLRQVLRGIMIGNRRRARRNGKTCEYRLLNREGAWSQ